MALIQVNYKSKALMRTVPVQVASVFQRDFDRLSSLPDMADYLFAVSISEAVQGNA